MLGRCHQRIHQANNEQYQTAISNIYNTKIKVNEIIETIKTKFQESIKLQSNGYFETQQEIDQNSQSYGEKGENALKISYALDNNGLIDKTFAEMCKKNFATPPLDGKISSCKTTEKKELQPLPFSLSTLQIAAGKMFSYTPQQVLDAAQSLYEKKLTTYPRSDCQYLPTTQFADAKKILANCLSAKSGGILFQECVKILE